MYRWLEMTEPDEHTGIISLDKYHKHKRNPKRQQKRNFTRGKLTKEDKKSIKLADTLYFIGKFQI